MQLDRTSPVPLYRQLHELLLREIEFHLRDPDYRFPGENHLCKRYGVSIATVRRVMVELVDAGWLVRKRGKGTFIAAAAARERLQPAAIVGVIVDMGYEFSRSSFQGEVLEGIEEAARRRGLGVIFHPVENPDRAAATREMRALLDELRSREARAVILMGTVDAASIENARDAGLRPVVIDIDTAGLADCVLADNFQGARALLEHLHDLGHRRIAYVYEGSDGTSPAYRVRLAAYRAFHEEMGLGLHPSLVVDWRLYHGDRPCEDVLRGLLAGNPAPTAIFACDDAFAARFLRAAMLCGVRVPEELSVTGFDGFASTRLLQPPLTTVLVDRRAMGCEAVRLALRAPAADAALARSVLPTRLLVRSSCAVPVKADKVTT